MALLGRDLSGRKPTNEIYQQERQHSAHETVIPKIERSQKDSVLFGNELKRTVPSIPDRSPVFFFQGTDIQGVHRNIPISQDILSKHLLLLGGSGTGKTNAFFQGILSAR